MNTNYRKLLAAIAAMAFTCAAAASDPLKDMEPIEPAPIPDAPAAAASDFPSGQVAQGRYLVTLLACGGCHTEGALAGKPDGDRLLAGSTVGIATSNPMQMKYPGVVFPSNLTPDPETGLGEWSVGQIASMLQSGMDRHGKQAIPVMPWMTYSKLTEEDATAIAVYLKSLPPVKHPIPASVRAGKKTQAPFVHFGVYRSRQN
ncbi:MAG: c-type cytochrome [Xanthomonadales bacterium]|nr:c-type cytochrome [Xanthomonadales bacterium]